MRMNVLDVAGEFGSQHQSLAETAYTVLGRIAAQVGKPCGARRAVSRLSARPQPAPANPGDFLVEVLGEIKQRSADLAVDRMGCAIGGVTERDDQDVQPA